MPVIRLRSRNSRAVLYEGTFPNIRTCLEKAIEDKVDLQGVSLSRANLTLAMLDGANLGNADLRHANLTGANISEARLDGADFSDAVMHGACLCFSSATRCRFADTSFGGTDIAGTDLTESIFAGLSCFSLDFTTAKTMKGSLFLANGNRLPCPMSRPPVVIKGLQHIVIGMDEHLMAACAARSYEDWRKFSSGDIARLYGAGAAAFFNTYAGMLDILQQYKLKVVDFM